MNLLYCNIQDRKYIFKYQPLFLDDQRLPQEVYNVILPSVNWVIVRDYNEFSHYICSYGIPTICSFDHDLASEHYAEYLNARISNENINYDTFKHKTGLDCVKLLINYCKLHNLPFPKYYIHSFNHIGARNMEALIKTYEQSL